MFEEQTEHDNRDRPDGDHPAEFLAAEHTARDGNDVAPEIDKHSDQRSELDDGGERGTRIVPAEQGWHYPKMCGTTDREKFGQALDDAQQNGLPEGHRRSARR